MKSYFCGPLGGLLTSISIALDLWLGASGTRRAYGGVARGGPASTAETPEQTPYTENYLKHLLGRRLLSQKLSELYHQNYLKFPELPKTP